MCCNSCRYGRTKLFNIMSSNEFNKRLASTGVESFAAHPGVAKTDLYRKMDKDQKLSAKVRACVTARCHEWALSCMLADWQWFLMRGKLALPRRSWT
jgi:NAD(P)-dependent dehydrogenase (short-subunit alcohol dehydrogenase family)